MNHLMVAGNLGADPEVRFTSSGRKVTSLRIAARVRGKKEETIWWRVSVWGEEHDAMIAHLKKGSSVMVSGDIDNPEIFTNKQGQPQISMSMTARSLYFSPFGRSDQQQGQNNSFQQQPTASHAQPAAQYTAAGAPGQAGPTFGQGAGDFPAFSDEEIPF